MKIKTNCNQCGKEVEINDYSVDKIGICMSCPECKGSFDIDRPKNAFIMEINKTSSKGFAEGRIFTTKEDLIKGWKTAYEDYEGCNYTVFDKDGSILVGGAMDSYDLDVLEALPSDKVNKKARETRIHQILKDLQIPAGYKSYDNLKVAINVCLDDKTAIKELYKKVYTLTAKINNTTVAGIDRSIRDSVRKSFCNADEKLLKDIFGTISVQPNKVFIAMICEYIKIKENSHED